MTPHDLVLDGVLAGLLVAVGALALYLPRIFSGVVLFIVYGLVLSVVWLRLAAPDVALTEAAIGAGITGALLIATLARLARLATAAGGARPGPVRKTGKTED